MSEQSIQELIAAAWEIPVLGDLFKDQPTPLPWRDNNCLNPCSSVSIRG